MGSLDVRPSVFLEGASLGSGWERIGLESFRNVEHGLVESRRLECQWDWDEHRHKHFGCPTQSDASGRDFTVSKPVARATAYTCGLATTNFN